MAHVPSTDASAGPPPPTEPPNAGATASSIHHYAIRLPPFWSHNPTVWFLQVECQFALSGITSQLAKFRHVVSVLPQEVAAQLIDVLAAPPRRKPVRRSQGCPARTDHRLRAKALPGAFVSRRSGRPPTDRTPASHAEPSRRASSKLVRCKLHVRCNVRSMHVRSMHVRCTFDASFLKQLFLQRLPPTVQMILTSTSTLSLPELALLADKVMEVALHSISAIPPAAITNPPIRPHPQACPPTALPPADPIVQLREDFERLSAMVASAVAPRSPRPRHRSPRRFGSRSSSRRRSPRRTAEDPPIGPCWYHQRFGTEARRCTRPCTWSGNATGDR
ncbi:uncharacterized protein LOC135388657 [Ornithodoros turicata]|uniref:uncharacterized protein LOC135388657 n=1 Tax=Ornithodoros turicata TaxID=34597 RepID=UPI0031399043